MTETTTVIGLYPGNPIVSWAHYKLKCICYTSHANPHSLTARPTVVLVIVVVWLAGEVLSAAAHAYETVSSDR